MLFIGDVSKKELLAGLSVVIGYCIMNPLMEEIQDTFGKSFLYHPVALWICIITLVYTQTTNWSAGILVVVIYEVSKSLWKMLSPEPPVVGQLRKLIHRVQNGEQLSDNDIKFLDTITPANVKISKT